MKKKHNEYFLSFYEKDNSRKQLCQGNKEDVIIHSWRSALCKCANELSGSIIQPNAEIQTGSGELLVVRNTENKLFGTTVNSLASQSFMVN